MSDNKKYYYLKFKENYFDQDHIKVIEAMKNGYEYSLIILKLYLKSLKFEGQLMINERIPYQANKVDILAGVLGHDPANVMHAINLAKDLGVMEILSSGEMFMSDIQNFIGHGSSEAERKRAYRQRLEEKKTLQLEDGTKAGQCPGQNPPELELELELEKDIEKKPIEKKIAYRDNIYLTEKEFNNLVNDYTEANVNKMLDYFSSYKQEKSYKTKSDNLTLRRWVADACKIYKKEKFDINKLTKQEKEDFIYYKTIPGRFINGA
jgi:predicted phage replisome organizer